MLSGRSQMPWNSSRSSVLRRGGLGTRRPPTALTASASSAGWCGDTTAGQWAAGRAQNQSERLGRALASWLTRTSTVLSGCEGTGRGGWLRTLRDTERAESLIQRCRGDKGTRRDVARPDTSSLGPSLSLQGPEGKGHYWSPGRVGAEASLEQQSAETLLGPRKGKWKGTSGWGQGTGGPFTGAEAGHVHSHRVSGKGSFPCALPQPRLPQSREGKPSPTQLTSMALLESYQMGQKVSH